jgi:predicted transcriptional regulator
MALIQDMAERGGTKRSRAKESVVSLVVAGLVEKQKRQPGGYVQYYYHRTEAGQKALEETV